MSDSERSEIELFYHFLGQHLETGEPTLSVDEAVAAFQDYQRDLEQLKSEDAPSSNDTQSE